MQRSRENGLLRLGQPLKSFRDRNVHFDIYDQGKRHDALEKLGELKKPTRLAQIQQALEEPVAMDSEGVNIFPGEAKH